MLLFPKTLMNTFKYLYWTFCASERAGPTNDGIVLKWMISKWPLPVFLEPILPHKPSYPLFLRIRYACAQQKPKFTSFFFNPLWIFVMIRWLGLVRSHRQIITRVGQFLWTPALLVSSLSSAVNSHLSVQEHQHEQTTSSAPLRLKDQVKALWSLQVMTGKSGPRLPSSFNNTKIFP